MSPLMGFAFSLSLMLCVSFGTMLAYTVTHQMPRPARAVAKPTPMLPTIVNIYENTITVIQRQNGKWVRGTYVPVQYAT